jgi:hypothetical protein
LKAYFCIFVFILFSNCTLLAQLQGIVVDKTTRLPIPFASIAYKTDALQKGFITDAQARFLLPVPSPMQITVSCIGYKTDTFTVSSRQTSPFIIALEEQPFLVDEVEITPKNNPALRIIRNVLANKDKNNFDKYDNYSYRNYFKALGGLQTSPELSTDSSKKEKSFNEHLLSETVSLCSKSGGQTEDKIIATRTSGFKTPVFGQFSYAFFHKAISFYNHSIQIFGELETEEKMLFNYVSPLTSESLDAYNFQLNAEYITDNDTLFEINYFPKKNRNFNALQGTLFISSNGYALTNIVAHPFDKGLIDFKFNQIYNLVDGKWFPQKLEEEISFHQMRPRKGSPAYFAYFITSSIDSIRFDTPGENLPKHLDRVYLDEESITGSNAILNAVRPVQLSAKEMEVYVKKDSAFRNNPIPDIIMNMAPKIIEGKIPVNKIDIDLLRFYGNNPYEGSRWGLGLHTNEYWLKYFAVGAYVGYGSKDKKLKYGGELEFTLNRQRSAKINYSVQNTLQEVGNDMDFNLLNDYGRIISPSRFEYCIENKISAVYHIFRELKLDASLRTQDVRPAYTSVYKGAPLPDYKADALHFSLRYAKGEKHTLFGTYRMVTLLGNPILNISYTRGLDFLQKNSFVYNRLEASVDLIAYNGLIGQSNLRLEGGYIDRSLPYGMLFTAEGSKRADISFVVNNTFQTMRPDEFLSDKYAHVFYSHHFGSLLFKTKRFSPEFSLAYNAGWGDLSDATAYTGMNFEVKNHIYQEAGIIVDNMLRAKFLNIAYLRLGLGGFLRCGYYQNDKFADNLALKVAVSFSFK